MILCPTCGYPIPLCPAELIVVKPGTYGWRIRCGSCQASYAVAVRELAPSPLSPKELERIRNQPR